MKRTILYVLSIILLFVFTLYPKQVSAVNNFRYAVCDQCGLCAKVHDDTTGAFDSWSFEVTALPSQGWTDCVKCLYPDIAEDKAAVGYGIADDTNLAWFETLKIAETPGEEGRAPQPKGGRFYSGIGCLMTSLDGFTEQGAAAALTRPLMNVLLSLGGGIAFLYLLYGAFLVITARGDPEQLSAGKRTIYGAIVGIVFAMSSVFLINLIAGGILKIPGFG